MKITKVKMGTRMLRKVLSLLNKVPCGLYTMPLTGLFRFQYL